MIYPAEMFRHIPTEQWSRVGARRKRSDLLWRWKIPPLSRSFSVSSHHRHQSWKGWGVATPKILGWGVMGRSQGGVAEGSWTGRKILLYLIMYTKYVQKW